jgi:hypothetical protein
METPADALIAGMLADEFASSRAAVPLRIREAELTSVYSHAGDIALDLFSRGQLPADRFGWMISTATAAHRYSDVVRILEGRLRSGMRLNDGLRRDLAVAYRQLGREQDARRASSDGAEPNTRSWAK